MNSTEIEQNELDKLDKMYVFRDRLEKVIYALNPYSQITFDRNLGILVHDRIKIVFFLFGQMFGFNRIVYFDEYRINDDDYYEYELNSIVEEIQRRIIEETLKHFDEEKEIINAKGRI